MRMFQYMSDVSRKVIIRNDYIRGRRGVADMKNMMKVTASTVVWSSDNERRG